jgi:hypothetical protein
MFVFLFMVLQLVLKQDPICDAISGLVMLMCLHITPFQGRAGVLKRMTNEQRLMGPSGGWIKIRVGGITDQT